MIHIVVCRLTSSVQKCLLEEFKNKLRLSNLYETTCYKTGNKSVDIGIGI